MKGSAILLFRNDLRLDDNPALRAAVEANCSVFPVFILSSEEEKDLGEANRWWLHHSLGSLQKDLESLGSRLILRSGNPLKELRQFVKETKAEAVFWNDRYEPDNSRRDEAICSALQSDGLVVERLNASLLFSPGAIKTKQEKAYQVFTPYYRRCLSSGLIELPQSAPRKIESPKKWPKSLSLSALGLDPAMNWTKGLAGAWQPGEDGAKKRLKVFLKEALSNYEEGRDFPAEEFVSRLSPHLHFGEISPRRVWISVLKRQNLHKEKNAITNAESFLRQLIWREFAHDLLHHFPKTPTEPLRSVYKKFPWRRDPKSLKTWQQGGTGYPIVDAGMRELWRTGWMHNRVRMIVGSFLVKDLLLPWQEGAKWFWDTLVDADLANNTFGWQWVAGCGADAAPYFRIFNPVSQGRKFDPNGAYVQRWVPELKLLPAKWIHAPWEAPQKVLESAGVELGANYPRPIVDHGVARVRALAALKKIKS